MGNGNIPQKRTAKPIPNVGAVRHIPVIYYKDITDELSKLFIRQLPIGTTYYALPAIKKAQILLREKNRVYQQEVW